MLFRSRLNRPGVIALFEAVTDRLRQRDGPAPIQPIDAKPLPVSRHSQDPDARFGRGAGGIDKGYKIYTIWADGHALPTAWEVEPMNRSEPDVGRGLIQSLRGSVLLLGDAVYDNNPLYQATGERGHRLLAPRRYEAAKGIGHHRHSPYRLEALRWMCDGRLRQLHHEHRRRIETRFGNLVGFGGGLTHLPPWVRRLHRVRLWVHGKLLLNAVRILEIDDHGRGSSRISRRCD